MSEKVQRSVSAEDSDSDYENESRRPRGLTGLQNLGNTCYLNSALQSLSNCPPLTNYFLDCSQLIQPDKSPMLSKSYLKLITELWHHKRPSYVVPSGVVSGIKAVHPMFRGYTQQDAQEFLRCLMDQLHEELKSPYSDDSDSDSEDEDAKEGDRSRLQSTSDGSNNALKAGDERDQSQFQRDSHERRQSVDSVSSHSELDYETCDSGLSSERSSNGGRDSNGGISDGNNSDNNEGSTPAQQQSSVAVSTQILVERSCRDIDLTASVSSDSIKTVQQEAVVAVDSNSLVRSVSLDSVLKRGQEISRLGNDKRANIVANTKDANETTTLLEKAAASVSKAKGKDSVSGTRSKSGAAEELGSGEGNRLKADNGVVDSGLSVSAASVGSTVSGDGVKQERQQHQHQHQLMRILHQQRQSAVPGKAVPAGGSNVSGDPVHQQPPHHQQKHTTVQGQGPATNPRKPKNIRFESIISQTFDGKILSSVRCLNCETVSTIKETFQDLSLPIPSKDHLHMLHSGMAAAPGGVTPPKGGTCGEVRQGWIAWIYSWMKGWFVGPNITLQDCLAAFFSADELKGDNMYSCEKCKKLRNGLKYSRVFELPEILSIHLKRFRHEFYSSKISTYISFPLEGLDMSPYLHKTCKNEATFYDLVAIICHHGTAGGGHYTAYCLNHLNQQWYEFDDQYVTEVDVSQVLSCEAYVLFYRKANRKMDNIRQKVSEIERHESSLLRFFISKQWMSRFHTFAEPGPITNSDFLCKHGGVPPGKVKLIDDLVAEIHQESWDLLYSSFGGGPVCNHLHACQTCHSELESIRLRQRTEKEDFILQEMLLGNFFKLLVIEKVFLACELNEEFQDEDQADVVYAISMAWFKEWEAFVKGKTNKPPGPIENSRIIMHRNGVPILRPTSDHGHLSCDMWLFLYRIYGGGPELVVRQSTGASVKPAPVPASPPVTSTPAPLSSYASTAATSSSSAGSENHGVINSGDAGGGNNNSDVGGQSTENVLVAL